MLNKFFKQNGKKLSFNKGIVIVDCNDEIPNGIYLIEKGFVKAYSLTERGNEHIYIIYKAGEIMPARWAFSDIKGDAIYASMTNVEAWKVDKSQLSTYLNNNPKELLSAFAYTNTIFDIFVNRVNDLEHMNAYLRTCSRLISLSKRFGKPLDNGILIDAPLTQQDIANSIAITRESVSREISKLIDKNIIGYRNQSIFIHDLNKLENEIKSYPD